MATTTTMPSPPRSSSSLLAATASNIAHATASSSSSNNGLPGPYDVLNGRGSRSHNHPGNVLYRKLIFLHRDLYASCPRSDKGKIARAIVQAVRSRSGNFLEPTGLDKSGYAVGWRDIGQKKALDKTSQALRDCIVKSKDRHAAAAAGEGGGSTEDGGDGGEQGAEQAAAGGEEGNKDDDPNSSAGGSLSGSGHSFGITPINASVGSTASAETAKAGNTAEEKKGGGADKKKGGAGGGKKLPEEAYVGYAEQVLESLVAQQQAAAIEEEKKRIEEEKKKLVDQQHQHQQQEQAQMDQQQQQQQSYGDDGRTDQQLQQQQSDDFDEAAVVAPPLQTFNSLSSAPGGAEAMKAVGALASYYESIANNEPHRHVSFGSDVSGGSSSIGGNGGDGGPDSMEPLDYVPGPGSQAPAPGAAPGGGGGVVEWGFPNTAVTSPSVREQRPPSAEVASSFSSDAAPPLTTAATSPSSVRKQRPPRNAVVASSFESDAASTLSGLIRMSLESDLRSSSSSGGERPKTFCASSGKPPPFLVQNVPKAVRTRSSSSSRKSSLSSGSRYSRRGSAFDALSCAFSEGQTKGDRESFASLVSMEIDMLMDGMEDELDGMISDDGEGGERGNAFDDFDPSQQPLLQPHAPRQQSPPTRPQHENHGSGNGNGYTPRQHGGKRVSFQEDSEGGLHVSFHSSTDAIASWNDAANSPDGSPENVGLGGMKGEAGRPAFPIRGSIVRNHDAGLPTVIGCVDGSTDGVSNASRMGGMEGEAGRPAFPIRGSIVRKRDAGVPTVIGCVDGSTNAAVSNVSLMSISEEPDFEHSVEEGEAMTDFLHSLVDEDNGQDEKRRQEILEQMRQKVDEREKDNKAMTMTWEERQKKRSSSKSSSCTSFSRDIDLFGPDAFDSKNSLQSSYSIALHDFDSEFDEGFASYVQRKMKDGEADEKIRAIYQQMEK